MEPRHSDARTSVMVITLRDDQSGVNTNGPRKRYLPVVRATGCGWFGDHGVAMEILRVYWSFKPLPSTMTSNISNAYNTAGCNIKDQTGAATRNSGINASCQHSFRLAKMHKHMTSDSKEIDEDEEAFCTFRERWYWGMGRVGNEATFTQATNIPAVVPGIATWDFTDGAGHGVLSTAPQLQLGGETLVNNNTSYEMATFGNLKIEASATIVFRLVTVDLETFQRCI